jgi:hypothetical protein
MNILYPLSAAAPGPRPTPTPGRDPRQLKARIAEAEHYGWLGEIAGLQASLNDGLASAPAGAGQ